MRILRLDIGQGKTKLDLHPFVTVVRELSATQRTELLDTVQGLARGATAGVRALVQNQGLLVDLDGDGDETLLSVTGAAVVVDCDAAEATGTAGLQAKFDQTRRRAEINSVIVEEIRSDLSPTARSAVADINSQLVPFSEEALRARQRENRRVAVAADAAKSQDPIIREAPPEVLDLQQRWDAHMERRAATEGHFSKLMGAVKDAEIRTAAARQAFKESEQQAKPVLLSRTEEARLEQLSFPEQDQTRKGRWRKNLKPEEEAEVKDILAKVGVESWTAYTLYRTAPTPAPERLAAAAESRAALEAAEADLAKVRTDLAGDRLTSDLNEEADAIRADARPHLGQLLPADLGQAFLRLVEEKTSPAWMKAVDELHMVLGEMGVDVVVELASDAGDGLGGGVGVDGGAGGSEEAGSGSPESELDTSLRVGLAVIEAAESWLEERRLEEQSFDVDRLYEQLREAETKLVRHQRALVRIERAEIAASSSAQRLRLLGEQLEACRNGGSATAESVLAMIVPIVAQIDYEADGPVPLAIVGEFEDMTELDLDDLMDELGRMGDRLQVLVLSEHPQIAAWAEAQGMEKALVTSPKSVSDEQATLDA